MKSQCENRQTSKSVKRPRIDQVVIVLSFACDLLREKGKFCGQIKEWRKAKPMQSQITFNIQLKIALNTD